LVNKNLDLVVVILLALISAGLGLGELHSNAWLSIFGIVVVLVLPGYVYSELLISNLPFEERLLVSLGLSIAIDGVSGLAINLTPWGLNSATWGVWLAIVTLIGASLLWRHRDAAENISMTHWPRLKISWGPLMLYGLALVFILVAFSILQLNAFRLNSPLTSLWASYDPIQTSVLNVGISNEEGKTMSYVLVVTENGAVVSELPKITLDNTRTFNGRVTLQQISPQPVRVLLYLADQPGQVYRQVNIAFPERSTQAQGK
jgi:uncharacterized membrane protein